MTWGQLRFQLQTSMPGVPIDLLDEWLNGRYEQVLGSTDWTGLHYHTSIQTAAAYQSIADSVTLTVGSSAMVGVLTVWTSADTLGMKFYRAGDAALYTVVAWNSANSITLDRPYEGNGVDAAGTVYSGAEYALCQNVYTLPADVGTVVNVLNPDTGLPIHSFSKAGLDASAGPRASVGDPVAWAPVGDTDEGAPPVLHQIEFFPPPRFACGIPVEYIHVSAGFDGSNTGSGPMPWLGNSVLLYGCRADGYAYLAGKAQDANEKATYLQLARFHEAKFGEEKARILRVEHQQRRQSVQMRMAPRFTRHRLNRAGRRHGILN
jgi:hypothetical protein